MKKKTRHTVILELALLTGLLAWLLTGAMALHTQAALSEKVVRLHVLANSDSEADQTLKLQVRDCVLEHAEALLRNAENRQEAERLLREALPELERIAEREITRRGYAYDVKAELETASFPTREYDGFALPAGDYLALRILIGEARGQNWWCVVFPPLCTAASESVPACALAAGLDREQVNLITEVDKEYVLKFKIVEFWQSFRQKFF